MVISRIILVFIFAFNFVYGAQIKYSPFIDKQIELSYKANDVNITQEKLKEILELQNELYDSYISSIIASKQKYINNAQTYDTKIFSLKKIITINKRAGNKYAVIRDEVRLRSYNILKQQSLMIKNILLAIDISSVERFEEKLDKIISKNRQIVSKLYTKKYDAVLKIDGDFRTLKQAKQSIKEFYAIMDIDDDFVHNIDKLGNKIYRLNKYSKYHLVNAVVFINNLSLIDGFNSILQPYSLSVVKLLMIFLAVFMVYVFRKIFYFVLERYVLKIDILEKYSSYILTELRKTIEILIVVISLYMVMYIYNDFSSTEAVSRFFNVLYSLFITFMVYKTLNAVASIKLQEINTQETKIKNELINVGIKIVNFIIFLIGLLFVLHFIGVDLTAVLGGLGIGGFAVAFAAKDTISNFFGTLSILFSDMFSQGDWIAIDGKEGTVVEIGLRVTTIRTFDNALIAIPNGIFASKDIKNWDRRRLGRRIKMSIGIKYDSKKEDIQKAVQEIREMLYNHPDIATPDTRYEYKNIKSAKLVSQDDLEGVKKTLLVYLDEFGDSSMNILIYCYSKSVAWAKWLETKEDVMYKIMDIMEKNSLEFAFPSLSVYQEK